MFMSTWLFSLLLFFFANLNPVSASVEAYEHYERSPQCREPCLSWSRVPQLIPHQLGDHGSWGKNRAWSVLCLSILAQGGGGMFFRAMLIVGSVAR